MRVARALRRVPVPGRAEEADTCRSVISVAGKRELTEYLNTVLDECLSNIPLTQRDIDVEKAMGYPQTWVLKTAYEPTMALACQARRQGASSRAEAIEWAYDSLIRGNGMKRVGEVYLAPYREQRDDNVVTVMFFQAVVRERHEDE